MNDECKTINVILQENGIIRSQQGFIIGRMATMDGISFAELIASQQPVAADGSIEKFAETIRKQDPFAV